MSATVTSPTDGRLAACLLLLRITLGLFLLQWGVEKFVVPAGTISIGRGFYGIAMPDWLPLVLGATEVVLAVLLLGGLFRRGTYGVALLVHAVSVGVTVPRMLNPYAPGNHLFFTAVPVLAAFIALYALRTEDRWSLDGLRNRQSST
jgi:putative oxidoreductase